MLNLYPEIISAISLLFMLTNFDYTGDTGGCTALCMEAHAHIQHKPLSSNPNNFAAFSLHILFPF